MPELPEVETIVQRLQPFVVGRSITSLQVLRVKSLGGPQSLILNSRIIALQRKAKIIIWQFASGASMLTHLKMTGQLLLVHHGTKVGGGHPTADWMRDLPSTHTRLIFSFDTGAILYFNDQRVFGWCRICTENEVEQEFQHVAVDIIDPALTSVEFFQKLQRTSRPVKSAILDNSVVAGIGNIYACDGLFVAGVSPTRAANSLTRKESDRLLISLQQVIHQGIELGGATISHYMDCEGLSGKYQDVRRVYQRENQACPVCGQKIERYKLGGRSTFWCSHCQT